MGNKQNEDQETNNKPQMARFKETIQITKFSRSSIYSGIADGTFPIPVRIGKRAIAFKLSELEKWIESRPRVQLNNKEDK